MNEEKINIPQNEAGEAPYIIEMRNITKVFPGIVANDDITLQLKKGEIHALLGENGAGKSTLMSVLFGLYKPEKGEILKNGEVVDIRDPNDANALGIGSVWLGTWPNAARVQAQAALFALPPTLVPHSILAFGYPLSPATSPRDLYDATRVGFEKYDAGKI